MSLVIRSWRLPQVARSAGAAGERGLRLAAEHLRTRSQELTPVETGALRGSAAVSQEGTRASVSYNTVYAARQHEEVGWQHPRGGQAKFLEKPLHDEEATMKRIIMHQIEQGMR